KLALVPLNSTALAPVKLVPLIVTLVPTGPLAGVKLVTVGGLMTVKLLALLAVPSGVVTPIGPLVAPAGTVAVIVVAEPTVKLASVGGLMTRKLLALLAVPSALVTPIGPLVAPAGTAAVLVVAEPIVKLAFVPLNCTPVTPVKFVPLIVTLVPTGPLAGVKLEIVGGLITEKPTAPDA